MWKSKIKDLFYILSITTLFILVLTRNPSPGGKTGIIRLKEVFDAFDMKKEMEQQYRGEMAGKKQLIDSLGFVLKTTEDRLDATGNPGQAEVNAFLEQRRQYMELVKAYGEENSSLNETYDSQILNRLNQYVKEYGQTKGYRLILGSLGDGNVMHADSLTDVTLDVIQFINEKYAGKK